MRALDELRREIDNIDTQLKELFIKRMEISEKVGSFKMQNAQSIYNPDREEQIIERFLSGIDSDNYLFAENFYRNLLNMSRARQYLLQAENHVKFPLYEQMINAVSEITDIQRVCFQGIEGSWSSYAVKKLYPNAVAISCSQFEDVFNLVVNGDVQMGILPIDNSTAGSVNDVYDLLVENDLYINRAVTIDINNCLLGVPGAELSSIKRVYSHPQALMQCSNRLKSLGIEAICESNTAVAAKYAAELNDPETGAIASPEAANAYGLQIISEKINDSEFNQTRFLAVSKQLVVSDNANRISLAFRLPNKSGSLYAALSVFSANGLNLTKIMSRPIPNRPWEYVFYLDCEIPKDNSKVYGALYQLSMEQSWIKLLGCYEDSSETKNNE